MFLKKKVSDSVTEKSNRAQSINSTCDTAVINYVTDKTDGSTHISVHRYINYPTCHVVQCTKIWEKAVSHN